MKMDNFKAFCNECQKLDEVIISGDASSTDNGCDSCGYGQSIHIELTIACPQGHTLWHADGDAAGIL